MLAPSVVRTIAGLPDLCALEQPGTDERLASMEARLPWPALIQAYGRIPLHTTRPLEDSEDYSGYAVVPTSGDCGSALMYDSIAASMKALAGLKDVAPDPSAQRKYQPYSTCREIQYSSLKYIAKKSYSSISQSLINSPRISFFTNSMS